MVSAANLSYVMHKNSCYVTSILPIKNDGIILDQVYVLSWIFEFQTVNIYLTFQQLLYSSNMLTIIIYIIYTHTKKNFDFSLVLSTCKKQIVNLFLHLHTTLHSTFIVP